jgi:rubrerythrin
MVSAFEIFSRAEHLERTAAELYRVVAETFPWSADEGALFRALAQEEFQHAARVRLLAAQYRNDARGFSVGRAALERMGVAERALSGLRSEISEGRWADDLPGLKARLADLEGGYHGSHADLLAQDSDPRISAFFRELARQDRAHLAMLRGGPPDRAANG